MTDKPVGYFAWSPNARLELLPCKFIAERLEQEKRDHTFARIEPLDAAKMTLTLAELAKLFPAPERRADEKV